MVASDHSEETAAEVMDTQMCNFQSPLYNVNIVQYREYW